MMKRVAQKLSRRSRLPLAGLYRAATGARAPLPRFLVVGNGRSGTGSLYRTLVRHPRIAAPYTKELNFFTTHFFLGTRWYRAMLDRDRTRADTPPITFEATPSYFWRPHVAGRIARLLARHQTCAAPA